MKCCSCVIRRTNATAAWPTHPWAARPYRLKEERHETWHTTMPAQGAGQPANRTARRARQRQLERGVNIEGLAARDGLLFFGFRGPAKDERAPILSTKADELFKAEAPKADVTFIEVGKGRGIRALARVNDGILVLAGPDDDLANQDVGWILGLWDGKPADVAKLKYAAKPDLSAVKLRKCDDELKPEALAVLRDEPDAYDVIIMSDGMCDGGPLKFTLQRK